ncbi:PH domain-containing protein [Halobacillus sp. A5]|uniref:PH domain-containing protein n=1 Tax=Halobacillus sp. A5 TaxID=2880263 RepID=UPI0020A682AD|nr:PH domain-containing protein [Halobacillus sp. A5]MCP3026842.1 PH domain-containing protein [Halobacillus sp. A5]
MKVPTQRISTRALTLWRLYGVIQAGVAALLVIGTGITTYLFDWPLWPLLSVSIVLAAIIILNIGVIPSVRWKRWRYEVRDQEIELQYGLFIITRTLVPMVRVQHVDTEQGPLLRKYKLATISISTAATTHKVPALDEGEAEELRHSISSLARVAEDDV